MARRVLDVDAATPDEVAVSFRGEQYVLGDSVLGTVKALQLAKSLGDSSEDEEQALDAMIGHLNPGLGAVLAAAPASVGERLALRSAITTYVTLLGRLSFRENAGG